MLNDEKIRCAFKDFIAKRSNKPKALIEELRIHDGNAIADVVAVYDFMHGYEIKGQTDKVERIRVQSSYYNTSFPLLTLVITANHLSWALDNLDAFWGIIVVSDGKVGVKFRHVRGAKTNPLFSTRLSLSMLWRNELVNVGEGIVPQLIRKSDSRATLADKISPSLNKAMAVSVLSKTIVDRYSKTAVNKGDMSC